MKGKKKMQPAKLLKSAPYNQGVMAGRPPIKDAPLFGQRLAAARKSRGWSQTQLAQKLDTNQKVIDYYERRAANPSLAFIRKAAKVLEVSTAELVGNESNNTRSRPGPPPALALRFEQIRQLPRKEQEFVMRFLDTVLEKAGRA
jgi:ribosome-binding protein aMBF1 (putative translation factor)